MNIIEPNELFDFSQLSLAHPTCIQGGAYFTKIEYQQKPLYIQTTKSQTKQGFVKNGKKYYCDLMFNKNDEIIIHWFEKLEETCQKLIYERRDTWFQNSLDENDIETAFNSTIRVYKSGKYYLIRTHIKNNQNNTASIKIYDEKESPLMMDDINSDTNIISILEIQGIKFTSRSFQIDIELKQIMTINDDPLFESCVIKNPSKTNNIKEQFKDDKLKDPEFKDGDSKEEKDISENTKESFNLDELDTIDTHIENTTPNALEEDKNILPFDLDFEDLNEVSDLEKNTSELKELDNLELSLEDNVDAIELKKPNQIYFELYKQARKKAKEAKKNAIIAYLEAKNIKKTYMIEKIDDGDSDFDEEIDEVSESELDNFEDDV
jgi:hypothetical protein